MIGQFLWDTNNFYVTILSFSQIFYQLVLLLKVSFIGKIFILLFYLRGEDGIFYLSFQ